MQVGLTPFARGLTSGPLLSLCTPRKRTLTGFRHWGERPGGPKVISNELHNYIEKEIPMIENSLAPPQLR
jgi:hypothetical protein